jgi:hypothetical protein
MGNLERELRGYVSEKIYLERKYVEKIRNKSNRY